MKVLTGSDAEIVDVVHRNNTRQRRRTADSVVILDNEDYGYRPSAAIERWDASLCQDVIVVERMDDRKVTIEGYGDEMEKWRVDWDAFQRVDDALGDHVSIIVQWTD